MIPNCKGLFSTPCYVGFKDKNKLIGVPAKLGAKTNASNTVFAVKRLIGRKFKDPIVQHELKSLPFKVIADKNDNSLIVV